MAPLFATASALMLLGTQGAAINAGNYPFGNVSAMIPGTQAIPASSRVATVEAMDGIDSSVGGATNDLPGKTRQSRPLNSRAQKRRDRRLARAKPDTVAKRVDTNVPLPKLMELYAAAVKAAQVAMGQYKESSLEIQTVNREKVLALFNQTRASKHVENTQAKLKAAQTKRVEAASKDVGNVPRANGDVTAKTRLASAETAVAEAEQAYLDAGTEEKSASKAVETVSAKADRAEATKAKHEQDVADEIINADTLAAAVKEVLAGLASEHEKHAAMIAELKKRQEAF